MQVTVQRKVLHEILSLGRFAEKQNAQPMLGYVRISCTSDQLADLEITNLQVALRATFPAQVRQPGVILLPIKSLLDVVKVFPVDELVMTSTETGTLLLHGGKTRFTLMTMDATHFPKRLENRPADERGSLSSEEVRTLLDMTMFSVCHDTSRLNLNGILWEVQPHHMRMVSTDGHRLSVATLPMPASLQSFQLVLPMQAMGELRKLADLSAHSLRIAVSTKLFSVTATLAEDVQVILSMLPVEAQFPPYERIKPETIKHQMVLDRVEFLGILRRLAIMQQNVALGTCFSAEGMTLNITAHNNMGDYEDAMTLPEHMQIERTTLNVKYLIDVLAALTDDQVIFELGGPLEMGVLRNASGTFYGVIMPMNQ